MEYKYLPKIQGVVKDFHRRIIPEDKTSDCLNVLFYEGKIKTRWGYYEYGELPLNGSVTAIADYQQLSTGLRHTIVFTTRDTYLYNTSTGQYDFITKKYSTGTAACTGTTAVVGAGGAAWDHGVWPSGVCQIKFGTTDINGTGTPDTWHAISTFTDGTNLVLYSAGPNTSGAVSYVIRICWSGTADDPHSIAMPYDDTLGEKILVATNGVDPIRRWSGTGSFIDLGGSPNKAKFVGYFGSVGFEHIVTAWTNDGSYNLPQTIEVSDAGETEVWSGTYYDLLNTNDDIKGIVPLQTRLMIYKEKSITEAAPNPSGGNIDPFNFNQNKIRDIGTYSINTVVDFGQFHLFFGSDQVYKFDGSNCIPVGTEIINTIMNSIHRKRMNRSFAVPLRDDNLYCLFVPTEGAEYPNKAFAFNYVENTWTIWKLNDEVTAYGFFAKEYAPSWTELYDSGNGPLVSEMKMRYRDLIVYDNYLSYLLGDKDGYVYEFTKDFFEDNGTEIEWFFETSDFPLNDQKHTFRLNELVLGLNNIDGGHIRVRCSVDFGVTWSDWSAIALDGSSEYFEAIANFIESGLQVRFQFDNGAAGDRTTPLSIESLMVGWNQGGLKK